MAETKISDVRIDAPGPGELPASASVTKRLPEADLRQRVREVVKASTGVVFEEIDVYIIGSDPGFADEDRVLSSPGVIEGFEAALDELRGLKQDPPA
jgi:hypothetical protein